MKRPCTASSFSRVFPSMAGLCLALSCSKATPAPGADDQGAAAQTEVPQPAAAAVPPTEAAPTAAPSPAAGLAPHALNAEGTLLEFSGEGLLEKLRKSGAKATIVNAWASWCGPCRREFPMLVKVAAELKKKGVEVVFVSVDEPNSHEAAIKFFRENGAEGPVFVAARPLGPFKAALHQGWPGMLPATFLFDEQAQLRYFWGGPVYEEELLPIVEKQLAGEKVEGEMRYGLSPGLDYRNE